MGFEEDRSATYGERSLMPRGGCALTSARAAAATYRLALMVMSSPRVPARGTPHVFETRVQGRICCSVETELRGPRMTPGPCLAIVEGERAPAPHVSLSLLAGSRNGDHLRRTMTASGHERPC
jgi:hypothetical protein